MEAIPPYNEQIEILKRQIGAIIPRQSMKDSSGATVMDPSTQVTSVHGYPVLDLALAPVEANFALPLVHETAGKNDLALLNIAVAAEINLVGDPRSPRRRPPATAGNSPNTIMAAAAAIIGPRRVERTLACTRALIDLFVHSGLLDARDESFDTGRRWRRPGHPRPVPGRPGEEGDPRPEAMLEAVRDRGGRSVFLKFIEGLGGRVSRDAILAAISTTIAWGPLMRKRISA